MSHSSIIPNRSPFSNAHGAAGIEPQSANGLTLRPASAILCIVIAFILMVLAATPVAGDSGYLTVKSNMPGIAVYVGGDLAGSAPVEMMRLAPGTYSVNIVSSDSLENVYWHLRQGDVGRKLTSLWTLAAINAGASSVRVEAGKVTEVFIDYGRVLNAPNEAKLIACGSTAGLFLVGAAVGFVIHWLAFR
jgi:hypothetical protein